MLPAVSWPLDRPEALVDVAAHLSPLAVAWVVRIPLLNRQEGHEALTRAAWAGLDLTPDQQAALLRGVRAPDVGLAGLLRSALPHAQKRHALRAWSGTAVEKAISELRDFITATHLGALRRGGSDRWVAFGAVLHALQDSYSPAHTQREGGRIMRVKHWGPLDPLRRRLHGDPPDEHGFPNDPRDRVAPDGPTTAEAQAAVAATRDYLELALRHAAVRPLDSVHDRELTALLDRHVRGASDGHGVGG